MITDELLERPRGRPGKDEVHYEFADLRECRPFCQFTFVTDEYKRRELANAAEKKRSP
ncbi:MAG: hypothetical protein ABIH03_01380 [Pseudomonadota bacterium]